MELLPLDHAELSRCLSSIFCLSDMYFPEHLRDGNEIEHKLKNSLVAGLPSVKCPKQSRNR